MKMGIDFKKASFKDFEGLVGLDAYMIADELKKPEEMEEAKKKRTDKAHRSKKREIKLSLPRDSAKNQVKTNDLIETLTGIGQYRCRFKKKLSFWAV